LRTIVIFFILFIFTPLTHFVNAQESGKGSVFESYQSENDVGIQDEAGELSPNNTEIGEGQIPIEEEISFSQSETSVLMIFVQMFGALFLVICLIYLLLRFVNKRTRSFRSNRMIQHVGGVPLGANRSVQMVRVGDQLFVLGVGDSIQLIKEITDKGEIERLIEDQNQELNKMEEPIIKLSNWITRRIKLANQPSKNELGFKELLNRQLKDVSASQQKIREAVKGHNK